jgi:formiminotetrahydrofolate cyclodeaminase
MVLAYSLGRKAAGEHLEELKRAAAALERASGLLLELAEEDAAAYGLLSELTKLPEDDARRVREYPRAVAAAVQAPLATCAACCDVLRLLESLAGKTNRRLDSDLAIAAILAESGARAGAWNVRVNLPLLAEAGRAGPAGQVERLLSEAAARRVRTEQICAGS